MGKPTERQRERKADGQREQPEVREVMLRRTTVMNGVQVVFQKMDPKGEQWQLVVFDPNVMEQVIVPLPREAVAVVHDTTAAAKLLPADALDLPQGRVV